jgi:hypothetical protein
VEIRFISHALRKFKLLEKYGFSITDERVKDIIKSPESVTSGKKGRKIAQAGISDDHVLRVVFEEEKDRIRVITFYPARRGRYEGQL